MASGAEFSDFDAIVDRCENTLIAALYAAATNPSPWRKILAALNDHFKLSTSAVVLDRSGEADHSVLLYANQPNTESIHRASWPSLDFAVPSRMGRAVIRNADPKVMSSAKVTSLDTPQAFAAHAMGISVDTDGRTVQLQLLRPRRAPRFDARDAALLERLVPHIAGTIAIARRHERLKRKCDLHDFVMDRVHIGLIVVDSNDEIVTRNETAAAMIAARAGVRVVGNRIHGHRSADTALLKRLIAFARSHPGEPCAGHLSRPSENRDICVFARSMTDAVGSGADGLNVAIFLRDMNVREAMKQTVLMEMFGLTNAEVRVAEQLAVGHSVAETAANLGIQLTTARGHLRSIFVKTGVNRQSELMRLLLI